MSRKLYSTVEVAKAAGMPLATLQFWVATGVMLVPPVQSHRGAGVRLWTDAQLKQIRKMRKFRQSSAFMKDCSARRAETLSKTLAPDKVRARMSFTSKATWSPERRTQASRTITNSWAVKAVRRRRINGIKRAWTPERREAQVEAMARIMADPGIQARRLAGLRRAAADPEVAALRIANLKRANARPGALRRKIKKMKETLHTPEVNARRTATAKALWADLRAGRAALAEITKPRRGPGAPPKVERNKEIMRLHDLGWNASSIAKKTEPDFATDRRHAIDRVRNAIVRLTGDSVA
jgi:DNA-binding transcriptional MerR regulator